MLPALIPVVSCQMLRNRGASSHEGSKHKGKQGWLRTIPFHCNGCSKMAQSHMSNDNRVDPSRVFVPPWADNLVGRGVKSIVWQSSTQCPCGQHTGSQSAKPHSVWFKLPLSICVIRTLPEIVQTLNLDLERQVRHISVPRGGGGRRRVYAWPRRTVAHLPSWRKRL